MDRGLIRISIKVAGKGEASICNATMWSNALCTLGVTKPLCNCLSIRQVAAAAAAAAAANQNAGAAITTGPTAATNAAAAATAGVNQR